MTKCVTGLTNPYGAYKQFVSLVYLGGLPVIVGSQEPYVCRAARKVHQSGLDLISYAKTDINMKTEQKRLITDLRDAASYLEQVQALEHALPAFKDACGRTEREIAALSRAIGGGWSERMFPMIEK